MIAITELYKLGFEYDNFMGKYYLHLENDQDLAIIDLKHSVDQKYYFTRMESGATLRFYNFSQLESFVNIVKRSLKDK